MDRALGSVKLRSGLEQIELRRDRVPVQSASRGFVVAATEPAAKALAADGPGLPVTINQQIGKGGAGGGVEELATCRKLGKHIAGIVRRAPDALQRQRRLVDLHLPPQPAGLP